ncbi:MAG TPA: hypothetical protein VLD83_03850 [Candidatus Binatia bacterium]|nr:hypothetical protein [Candidatus Binatia bacterium]
MSRIVWEPPAVISRDAVLRLHQEVTARPSLPTRIYEDIFRLEALEPELPQGIVPAVAKLWHDAIMNGFYRI